jgi:prevent-host-death family protein
MTNMEKKRATPGYNIAEAKSRFSELVQKAMLGEEVLIARDNRLVAKLVPLEKPLAQRKPGSGKGQILHIATDFDAPLDVFKDYS